MPWPTASVSPGDIITATQLNLLPIRIADTTVGVSGASSIDFTSLPSQFSHLMIEFHGRGDTAALFTPLDMRVNNDSAAANYEATESRVDGVTPIYADVIPGVSGFVRCARPPAASATTSYFGGAVIWIPNYAATVGFKQFMAFARGRSSASNNTGWLYLYAGSWLSTAAINRLTFFPEAGNLIQGSRITVHGLA